MSAIVMAEEAEVWEHFASSSEAAAWGRSHGDQQLTLPCCQQQVDALRNYAEKSLEG